MTLPPAQIPAVALPSAMDLVPGWTFFGLPPIIDGTTAGSSDSGGSCGSGSGMGLLTLGMALVFLRFRRS